MTDKNQLFDLEDLIVAEAERQEEKSKDFESGINLTAKELDEQSERVRQGKDLDIIALAHPELDEKERAEIKKRHGDRVRKENKKMKKKISRRKRIRGHLIRLAIAIVLLFLARQFVSYTHIPFIEKWRTIYIETAMSTNSHQWLATWFFPKSVIDDVMEAVQKQQEEQKELESSWEKIESQKKEEENVSEEEQFFQKYWEINTDSVRGYLAKNPALTQGGYDHILIEDLEGDLGLTDVNGNEVLVVNAENNLLILGVAGEGFVGKLALTKDPAQVEHAKATRFGERGDEIQTFCKNNDAVLAINASAFLDVDGHGSGGTVVGSCVFDGKEYGEYNSDQKVYGMKYDNRFYINNYSDTNKVSDYRWAVQFYPAIVVDGKNVLSTNYGGMGIQPRTCIGQAEDGTFMMLTVDGRQPGYSLGTTVAVCADILVSYHAYQVGNLDGGSSTVMIYKGEQITRSSSVSGRGRFCPDALIVKKASDVTPSEGQIKADSDKSKETDKTTEKTTKTDKTTKTEKSKKKSR